jgi:hypothetical protein
MPCGAGDSFRRLLTGLLVLALLALGSATVHAARTAACETASPTTAATTDSNHTNLPAPAQPHQHQTGCCGAIGCSAAAFALPGSGAGPAWEPPTRVAYLSTVASRPLMPEPAPALHPPRPIV